VPAPTLTGAFDALTAAGRRVDYMKIDFHAGEDRSYRHSRQHSKASGHPGAVDLSCAACARPYRPGQAACCSMEFLSRTPTSAGILCHRRTARCSRGLSNDGVGLQSRLEPYGISRRQSCAAQRFFFADAESDAELSQLALTAAEHGLRPSVQPGWQPPGRSRTRMPGTVQGSRICRANGIPMRFSRAALPGSGRPLTEESSGFHPYTSFPRGSDRTGRNRHEDVDALTDPPGHRHRVV
jgi:hypothetical protein